MPVPEKVMRLIERFDQYTGEYRSDHYNETQTRREFIDPLFSALGWDVDNERGKSEADKEVIHEDAVLVADRPQRPDYSFRLDGTRAFFVEAKRPSVHLEHDPESALQLRRYGWSAKLPVSVVTNFAEFAVYDCRVKPENGDAASVARPLYLRYTDYANQWDEIVSLFSPEAVIVGTLASYAESLKSQKGIATVDVAFLAEIETWRKLLAEDIAYRNPSLSVRELNFAVQMTIDRIVFLRICEDREIERYGRLRELEPVSNVYGQLCELFIQADDRYNSGLFHFRREHGRAEPDDLTLGLAIGDAPLRQILHELYYPESPYEFSVLPADILGQVYEQFLGKVIRLTDGRRAVIEEKPEVRKAGGVYYTPTYVVDHIVQETVGRLIEGKTPKQIAQLTILDPACGSGSFLLGAYQHLLDWYLTQYLATGPQKHKKELRQRSSGDWYLTTTERKRILLAHIYGVDTDPQAVEVTKLSLLLKVLEDETERGIIVQRQLLHERALPDLSLNIKCGNSLIGSDYFGVEQMRLMDEDQRYAVNPFDWQSEFPQVIRAGGFDVVLGNPPYLYSAGQSHAEYFAKHFHLTQYQTDYYVYFIERALSLVRQGGRLSFIVSDSWLNSEYFSMLRTHLLSQHRLNEIAVFDYPVFRQATLENSIFVVTAGAVPAPVPILRFHSPREHQNVNTISPQHALASNMIDPRQNDANSRLIAKIEMTTHRLDTVARINRGIHAYRTDGYGLSKFGAGPQIEQDKETQSYHADSALDSTYLQEIKGKDVARFLFHPTGRYVSYGPWLAEPRTPEFFFSPKVALRKILGPKLHGVYIVEPMALDQSLYILISDNSDGLKFLSVFCYHVWALGICALNTLSTTRSIHGTRRSSCQRFQ